MGKEIKETTLELLEEILERMGLMINKEKSKKVKAKTESFNFLGFTVRYDKDLWKEGKYYWNILPSEKAQKKVRENISETLTKKRSSNPTELTEALNKIMRGWLNYYSIESVSYTKVAKKKLRYYLVQKLYRYYKKKSQRKCKLYRKGAFNVLVDKYGLINPCTYSLKIL
jgi:hypothetical protein